MMYDRVNADRVSRSAIFLKLRCGLAAAAVLLSVPAAVQAQAFDPGIEAALRSVGGDRNVRAFYAARDYRPIWTRGGRLGPEALRFLDIVETADAEGLDPDDYKPRALASAIEHADDGSPRALAKAEMLLSRSFAAYVRDVRRPRRSNIVYVDRELAPAPIATRDALAAAAAAPSFARYVGDHGWMNPTYVPLRRALVAQRSGPELGRTDRQETLLRLNLERARLLPADPVGKYIVVDAAAARLWMYEGGRVRDTMRVVVGKSTEQTPIMAGLIRFAMVNPYWNIPPDLVRLRVASGALKSGPGFLRTKNYEVLSDWTENASVVDPARVDWRAVSSGSQEIRVRQLPGKDNAMGKMKFMFPNALGIYLHDSPEKALFKSADRRFSSGCVRVEDAARLAKWMFGKPLQPRPGAREKQVDLTRPVPVHITYMTAAPEGAGIVFRPDIYNRDAADMARIGGRAFASR